MARNIFNQPPKDEKENPRTSPAPQKLTKLRGSVGGLSDALREITANGIRDIEPDQIDMDGLRYRLELDDSSIDDLAESIRKHGQQVPIMVRPSNQLDRYRIVYGRRRLTAIRKIGGTVKAIVRTLDDEASLIAQGHENTKRLDPSFIEKALFATELAASWYEQEIILDALAVDKPMLSRMTKVARSIPKSVVEQIGSAHGIGRRRWEELADRSCSDGVDLEQITAALQLTAVKNSDERFDMVSDAVAQVPKSEDLGRRAPSPALSIKLSDGTTLAEVKETARTLTLNLSKSKAPEFAQWMRNNAEAELTRLYEAWQSEQTSD